MTLQLIADTLEALMRRRRARLQAKAAPAPTRGSVPGTTKKLPLLKIAVLKANVVAWLGLAPW